MTERICSSCGHELTRGEAYCSRCGTFVGRPDPQATGPTTKKRRNAWEVILDRLRASLAPRYRVMRLLGYGGMAGVYLAEESRLGRKVAIKVISPTLMVDPAQAERFEQEARTTAQLDHPNIVTVYEVDERDELHFFTMTYVQGRSLSQVMSEASQPLELRVIRAWLGQIASALAYAHSRGVVHRDIKPGNVLLDESGKALVGDFGIAKVQNTEGLTRTGMLVGTPSYMSPEQCSTGKVTGASDQYSLGAVAYQMLTGDPPFSGPTMSVIQAHLNEPPKRIRDLRPDCPEALEEAVLRMLAKQPEERFPSLQSALDDLSGGPLRYDDPARERMAELARWTDSISIEVEPSTITEIPVAPGERFTLRAVPRDADGTPLPDRRVEWSTSPGDVFEVGRDGNVLALKRGRANIVASSAGVSEQVEITVEMPAAAGAPPEPGIEQPTDPAPVEESEDEDSGWEMRLDTETTDGGSATRLVSPGDPQWTPAPDPAQPATPTPAPAEPTPVATPDPTPVERPEPVGATPGPGGNRGLMVGGGIALVAVIGFLGWTLLSAGNDLATEPPTPADAETLADTDDPAGPGAGQGASVGGATTGGGISAGPGEPDASVEASSEEVDEVPAATDPTPTETADDPPVTVEDEAPPPEAPPEPRPGVLGLGGSLPADARVTITGNGVQRTVAGGSASLPPGTYRVDGQAPGFESVSGTVVVPEGGRVTWSPEWVAVAPDPVDPDPAPAEPAGPTPEEDRAAVLDAMQAFTSAVEARDAGALRAAYPRISGGDLANWENFFGTQGLRDLTVQSEARGAPSIDGDRAELRFDMTLSYTLRGQAAPATPVPYEAVLVRDGDGWIIDQLRQVGG